MDEESGCVCGKIDQVDTSTGSGCIDYGKVDEEGTIEVEDSDNCGRREEL